MQIKKIQKTVFENIFVSEDGKYESRCSADVIEYEKKHALSTSKTKFLYKTNTQANYYSGSEYSEYYIYQCNSSKGLKYAIMDVFDRLDYSYTDSGVESASKKYQDGTTIYAIRIVNYYDGPRGIKIKTLNEVISELTKEKEGLIKQEQNIYNNILELNKLSCKEN